MLYCFVYLTAKIRVTNHGGVQCRQCFCSNFLLDMASTSWVSTLCLFFLAAILQNALCKECPKLDNSTYSLNVRGNGSANKSEFLCDFVWTDREHLKEKLLDRLKRRQKSFVRFTVPVMGYTNPHLSMYNASGYLTWAWVLDGYDYMLFYPHNFIITSTMALGIITQDWAIDYTEGKAPVTLQGFGVDPDEFDTDDIVGHCNPECVRVNKSCGIGKYELEEFLIEVTDNKTKYNWDYLCLQSPYKNIRDLKAVSQFAFPDLLYQWRFLSMFYSSRPLLGLMKDKEDFPHYYCYNTADECELRELLSHYLLIPAIGILLWLYSPLLIHYFPSSGPKTGRGVSRDMFPSYKTPIYFGRCLKCMLCFYTQRGTSRILIVARRLLFLSLLAVTSFRLLTFSPYFIYAWPLLVVTFLAALIPGYLSQHITAELPSKFMFWDLPEGLVRKNLRLSEYQQLAFVMQERLYLFVNWDFWLFICNRLAREVGFVSRSCNEAARGIFLVSGVIKFFVFLGGFIVFMTLFVCWSVWFIFPLFYFIVTLLQSIYLGEKQLAQSQAGWLKVLYLPAACCHGVAMVVLLLYTIVALFSWCFAFSEFSMFTIIGAALSSSMAFQYFVLVGAVGIGIYNLVRDLHDDYNQIVSEAIDLLKTKDTFTELAREVQTASHGNSIALVKKEDASNESKYSIEVRIVGEAAPIRKILIYNGITTYISNDMFGFMVKRCKPLGRQILFITVKIIIILFYTMVALWVKNVYHLEDKVSNIVKMIDAVAVYNLPNILQFISHKSNFGKKTDVVLKQEVYRALVKYLKNLT